MQEGELPEEMTPKHNDESSSSGDEASDEEGEIQEARTGKKGQHGTAPAARRNKKQEQLSGEIQLGSKLTSKQQCQCACA